MTGCRLYLVCGLPGAGKTRRSHQIVDRVNAVHLCADEWVEGLGRSLVDYEFRVELQNIVLTHARGLLRSGVSVVVEFGSWSRDERETIRQTAVHEGASTELHYLDAPLEELVRRVRERGGPDADALASTVLLQESGAFEAPTPREIARFDRYVGPDEEWEAI